MIPVRNDYSISCSQFFIHVETTVYSTTTLTLKIYTLTHLRPLEMDADREYLHVLSPASKRFLPTQGSIQIS